MAFHMSELISRKRDGEALSEEEVRWIVSEYTAASIPDYQMSALLMAVVWRGMEDDELWALTDAMLHSGEVLDLSAVAAPKVDKHSTGGVGDKISIPLVPLVAAAGAAVPMISGRGLGHTGGTLDKLESIPGFSTQIDPAAFARQLDEIGVVMAGQTESLVPADLHLYALRDATGTVPSVPLIASSIMSKKLAEDIDGLLLDVKVGSGATLAKDIGAARELAATMAAIGAAHQTPVVAMLTDMSQPLGVEVGNACEIEESISVLRGEGPADVTELVVAFGAEMLVLAGIVDDAAAGRAAIEDGIASGAGLERMAALVAAQGGDPRVIEDPHRLPRAGAIHELTAPRSGYVAACDALAVGVASVRLGAGRARKEDAVDPGVGISILAKRGSRVEAGQPLARIRYDDEARRDAAAAALGGAWTIAEDPPAEQPLIIETVR
jgi:pyrimidine-nucleoside phosphorylase